MIQAMPESQAASAGKSAPNCLTCRHFYVTWERAYPRGCKVFGLKSKRLPSLVLFESTGYHCPVYEVAPGHRGSPEK